MRYCTEKVTRGAAIITVKRWVPDVHPMDDMVRDFATQILRRLQRRPSEDEKRVNMEDGQLPTEDLVQTPYLPEQIELPAQKAHVLQHVELLFALSVKVPEFLDEYVFDLSSASNIDGSLMIEYSRYMVKWKNLCKKLFKSLLLPSLNLLVQVTGSF